MNILHIAYSLGESSAATRLAEGQVNEDNNVYFLLGRRSKDLFVRERQIYPFAMFIFASIMRVLEKILFRLSGVDKSEIFSFGLVGRPQNYFLKKIIKKYGINLIHLHWGGVGFFPLKSIRGINEKILLTTHDYHYLTGGCHIPMDCDRHLTGCVNCPLVGSEILREIVHRNRVQNKQLGNLDHVKIISPSAYTSEVVKNMQGKKVFEVPNTFGNLYSTASHDVDEMIEKYTFHASKDKAVKTLLAIGVNKSKRNNKGQDILSRVIDELCDQGKRISLITVGEDYQYSNKLVDHIKVTSASTMALKELYAISDLCLVPSRYETFSQVTLESVMCCTPVVAFDLTGPKDILGESYPLLVRSFEINDFISTVANNLEFKKDNLNLLRNKALEASLKFSPSQVTSLMSRI
jgi:glycosyltransferase involved in cell wall biosynthesis